MLTSTYIHIPGIGNTVEKKIWKSGSHKWEDFLRDRDRIPIPEKKKDVICEGLQESMEKLRKKDSRFFAKTMPGKEHWRAYKQFSGSIAYVDIETTGLSRDSSDITVIGIYDGKKAKTYVKGIDLEKAARDLPEYDLLVTFNGARFDLPFIQSEFPELEFDQLHIDLMYPLRRIGYCGGLKAIERNLGITRTEETTGISGFDAVRLWYDYKRGNEHALDILLEYNREDIVNLETIIEKIYPQFVENAFK